MGAHQSANMGPAVSEVLGRRWSLHQFHPLAKRYKHIHGFVRMEVYGRYL